MIDPGAQAAPGMPLLTVEDDLHYRVETTVDEGLAGAIHVGDLVTVEGAAKPISARVTNVVSAVDPGTRSGATPPSRSSPSVSRRRSSRPARRPSSSRCRRNLPAPAPVRRVAVPFQRDRSGPLLHE
jgi:hypothetical protein